MSYRTLICSLCPNCCEITFTLDAEKRCQQIRGNHCSRGADYVANEVLSPLRILTTLVKLHGGSKSVLAVRTRQPMERRYLLEVAQKLRQVEVHAPVTIGQPLFTNFLGLGIDIIASENV